MNDTGSWLLNVSLVEIIKTYLVVIPSYKNNVEIFLAFTSVFTRPFLADRFTVYY